jgi:formylglycine-generating enzyme required for sulfatase activity
MLDYSIRLAEDWSRKPLYPYIIDNRYIYESIVSYREGNGSLTVKITPEPLMVEIFKINETPRGDFETEEQPSIILKDGNRSVQIPKGEYVAHIETQHLDKIIYSFKIEHIEAEEINLHLPDKVPTQMIFIPGGPAWVGGPFSSHNKLINTNISSFFIKKYEVTFAEYYKFWRTLDTFNRNRYCPYIQLNENIKSYVPAWDKYGNYNSFCKPYLPVVGVTHEAADAFCKWLSIKENQKYRLPTNLEWEKAARGGDCRKFVWGNDHTLEKTFTRSNKEAKENYKFWAKPGSFPDDMSVYGVMDMSGNVREWTSTRFSTTDNFFLIKGGSAFTPDNFLYCEAESYTSFIPSDVGFRYIQEIEKPKVDNEN